MIYRNLFLPEWDSDMEAFFDSAVAELKRYSEDCKFPDWTTATPEISELDDFYEIRFDLPEIEPESH